MSVPVFERGAVLGGAVPVPVPVWGQGVANATMNALLKPLLHFLWGYPSTLV